MPDVELTRIRGDRDLYALEGVGTLRLEGLLSTRATAEAAGQRWHIARHGLWRRLQATDAAGTVVGAFDRRLRGGGILLWDGRELALRRASVWRERYALADGDHELVLFDGRAWGKRPVTVTAEDIGALHPGMVLFSAFVVRTLAQDTSSGAAAASSAATAG